MIDTFKVHFLKLLFEYFKQCSIRLKLICLLVLQILFLDLNPFELNKVICRNSDR